MNEEFIRKEVKLFNEIDEYNFNENALRIMEDERFSQKTSIREELSKHPLWIPEKEMIVFEVEVERSLNKNAVYETLRDKFYDNEEFLAAALAVETEEAKKRREYEYSIYVLDGVYRFWKKAAQYADTFIDQNFADWLNDVFSWVEHPFRFQAGAKTSKTFNKIMSYFGYDKAEGFNKYFATYSNAINPNKVKRKAVISLNPLDFLLMSRGNSWHSCHSIEINKPDHHGEYSSGTISYMLDDVSFVYYHVDINTPIEDIELQPKIIRQMYHYHNHCLVQGRLYPQSNDGANNLYTEHRAIVQKVLADSLGVENLWKAEYSSNFRSSHLTHVGTHYPDYNYDNGGVYSWLFRQQKEPLSFAIGADPISISSGERHHRERRIDAEPEHKCASCGRWEEDAIEIDGEWYCRDCVTTCEDCGALMPINDESHIAGHGYVCQTCLERDYEYCESCGHWVDNDSVTFDVVGNVYCENCAERYLVYVELEDEYYYIDDTFVCSHCGERHPNEECTSDIWDNLYCEECAHEHLSFVESEDAYYLNEDVFYCVACDEYHLLENEDEDEEYYNEEGERICYKAALERGIAHERAS